ncbi:MAG: protein kinase domain-containing protein [Bryobacteraceae bacterium]
MNVDQWREVERLFHSALHCEPARRAEFLREACAGDLSLQHEVESLIARFEDSASILEAPAPEVAALIGLSTVLQAGERIGPYEILDQAGAGGMGEVYRARDTRLGRIVAIKFPSAAFHSRDDIARFQREARAASLLNHPNIVTVHDFGESIGRPFLVTEFVTGETLREWITRGSLPLNKAIEIIAQIASALQAAHRSGIVHRDIKPENIKIRPDGYVKVLDFGLARFAPGLFSSADSPSSLRTIPGVVLGTLPYMSPEQLRGEPVDARADLWSLGAVLYETVTGRPPFAGATPNHVAVAILESPPARLTGYREGVPESLDQIIRRALAKERECRYQTAEEFLAELNAVRPPPSALPSRVASLRLRWPRWVPAVLALVAAVVAGSHYLGRFVGPRGAGGEKRIERLTTDGRSRWAAISPDGKYVAYTTLDAGQQSLWIRQTDAAGERQLLPPSRDRFAGVTFSNDSSHVYYVAYGASSIGTLFRLPVLGGVAPQPVAANIDSPIAHSPDGTQFAFVRTHPSQGSSELVIAGSDGARERVLAKRKSPQWFSTAGPSWSPDGRSIACAAQVAAGGVNVVTIAVSGGSERVVVPPHPWIGRVGWFPDGKSLAVPLAAGATLASQIVRVSYPQGQIEKITDDLTRYSDLSITDDSESLVTVQTDPVAYVSVVSLNPWRELRVTSDLGRYEGIAWTASNSLLTYFLSGKMGLWMLFPGGAGRRQVAQLSAHAQDIAVCGQGRHFVLSSYRGGLRNLWRMDSDGRNWTQLTTGPGADASPQCSPDGRTVFFTSARSGTSTLWSVPIDGGEPAQLTRTLSFNPAISPDGRFLAYECNTEPDFKWTVALLPLRAGLPETAAPVRRLDTIPRESGLRWAPDGRALTYIDTRDGVGNIWSQPLQGGAPTRITRFEADQIFSFAWSRDGRLALVRGTAARNVVLIRWGKKK